MRKLIATINMSLDGFCDHTAMLADEETHQHFTDLLRSADTILFGRITYQLMEYWRSVVESPTGNRSTDDFAKAIDNISKVVFSRTLEDVDWKNTVLKKDIVKDEIIELTQHEGKNILVGSPSLIVALGRLGLIDEYQLVVHPTVLGSGLPLFKDIGDRIDFALLKTKTFACGAVAHYYQPTIRMSAPSES